ncbi:MAG TPA: hypothetical protein VGD27_08245 [Longimicrobiales bacterium]
MMKRIIPLWACALIACGGQVQTPSAGVVDSIFPVAEEMRRFKAARHDVRARNLAHGASSRDQLVHRFITALERADTAALRGLIIDASEFIDLYYPSSIFARPPYHQDPELRWFLIQENSNKGLTRLLRRFAGQPTGFRGYHCAPEPTIEGKNKVWDRCRVEWGASSAPVRAFSTIIERDGRFKILSYANDL